MRAQLTTLHVRKLTRPVYHIHEKAVPEDGNCTGTGAHLDPYKRGEVPICDASNKESCQTGDLSSKYGNITGTSFSAT